MNENNWPAAAEKTPFKIVALQFSNSNTTYFYRIAETTKVEPGDRLVVANRNSFSIPTAVAVYPAGSDLDDKAEDWVVQVVDTTEYQRIKREYAL